MDLHDGSGRVVRHVRAAVLSTVVVVVSLLAHVSGGGDSPPVAGLVAGWALLAALLSRVTRHKLRLPLVLGLLAGGQLLVHLALTEAVAAKSPAVADAIARTVASNGLHNHHGMVAAPSTTAAMPMADTMATMDDGGWAMLAAHLLAAVAVGGWLVAGERAVWQLAHVVAAVVLRSVKGLAKLVTRSFGLLRPVVSGPPVTVCRVWLVTAHAEQLALGASSRRRGPPAWGC